MKLRVTVIGALALVGLVLLFFATSTYVVDETEQVVVTQFGAAVREVTEAGLKLKKPFIQDIIRLDKRILSWDGDPDRMPTRDKKNIYIDVWGRWRISSPLRFYEAVGDIHRGHAILDDFVDGTLRDAVGAYSLIELVRSTNRDLQYETEALSRQYEESRQTIEVGRATIEKKILEDVNQSLTQGDYGMQMIDVHIKRINYVDTVRQQVYARMKSERESIAALYRSEGDEESDKIRGEMQKQLDQIEGEATRRATETRGQADAEVIRIYGEAITRAQELYSFQRALDALKLSLAVKTELVLTTDMPLVEVLERKQGGG